MVILHAATAPAALHLLEFHDLAVVILDLRHPTPDGGPMAELICRSAACGGLPIIVLGGGHAVPWDALSRERAGLLDVLHASAPSAHLQSKLRFFLELHRQRRLLEEAAQSLEQSRDHFISTLTHDMRTPLASILLCVEKLSFELRSNVHVRRTLEHLNTSADGLARALERLQSTASVDDASASMGWIDSAPTPHRGPPRLHGVARRILPRHQAKPSPSRREMPAMVDPAAEQSPRPVPVSKMPAARR